MRVGRALGIGVPLLIGGAAGAAHLSYRHGVATAKAAMREIQPQQATGAGTFEPEMVAGQPQIARRYFQHAIAPGTPLASVIDLEMRGTFLLGDKNNPKPYAMTARQRLRPPFEFVWMPVLRSGAITVTGSDALAAGTAWTRFWLMGLVPVANVGTSADIVRSAQFRAASEGLWLPASLLPQNGVRWEQTGPDQARLTFARTEPAIVLNLTLAPSGAVEELVGERWSNANREQRFKLQPFGGTVQGERRFGGFTIPHRLNVGNHFGTADFLPFFQAEITRAAYS